LSFILGLPPGVVADGVGGTGEEGPAADPSSDDLDLVNSLRRGLLILVVWVNYQNKSGQW